MVSLRRTRRSVLYRFRRVFCVVMIVVERSLSVLGCAMVMILQNFDDPTLTDMAVTAFLHHALQLPPQGLKLFQAQFHLLEV